MYQVKWIADIGSNHNQNWERCVALIHAAKEVGCQAVKFQLFRAELMYAPSCKKQIAAMKPNELPLNWLNLIRRVCTDLKLEFICTPFDLEAVNFLEPYVDAYKIASYELLWDDLLKAVLQKNKPILISVGMATVSEISHAYSLLHTAKDLTIFHCSAKYPSVPSDCDLWTIRFLDDQYPESNIGWSDHTVNPQVIYAAIALGAKTIEFHLDLEDGLGVESKHGHCWRPSQIAPVIHRHVDVVQALEPNMLDPGLRNLRREPTDGLRPMKCVR